MKQIIAGLTACSCVFLCLFSGCTKKNEPEKTGTTSDGYIEVGYVDTENVLTIDELWKGDNIGDLVTLDFKSFRHQLYDQECSYSGVRFGDISGVNRGTAECCGKEDFVKFVINKQNRAKYIGIKTDTTFFSSWEVLLASDMGSKLTNFTYGTEWMKPLRFRAEIMYRDKRLEAFLRSTDSYLCGYPVLKNPYYRDGEYYNRWCHTDDTFDKLLPSLQYSTLRSVIVEARNIAIIPVGYRYRAGNAEAAD